ncbi:hypothetical protein ASZ78_012241 [Callipepla squamata]|uniref:Uncharacterized protein n=1 Tax=Callipepla squamata TaxID=9009 RepID=A0A226MAI1_CALSU|nr:hypothetical protein ASZ78_012241 [Callipepla squamata]
MPRLLTLQAADDSASAADASQGMLGNCATRPKAEGQVSAPADSQTTDVQAVQQTSEEIAEGETAESGDLQSPSDEAEADTACSASLPDAHPTPAGHPQPLQDPRETTALMQDEECWPRGLQAAGSGTSPKVFSASCVSGTGHQELSGGVQLRKASQPFLFLCEAVPRKATSCS